MTPVHTAPLNRFFKPWVIAWCVVCLAPASHATVRMQALELPSSGGVTVPVEVAIPAGAGPFLPVLYIHARRGFQDVDREQMKRIAQAGFLVVAPDWQTGRMLERWPLPHDPETELDVALALDYLMAHPLAKKQPVGIVGKSRGPYYAIRLAASRPQDIGAIVSYYGHMQNPNAPEPEQVYGIAPEVKAVRAPMLMLVGEQDFELRRINMGRAFYALWQQGVVVEYQSYPLARRAFDFRVDQTPEEKLATEHAHQRTLDWLHKHMVR